MIPADRKISWLAGALLLMAAGLLYWGVVPSMIRDWYHDENYSHGFLIPLISGYLIWSRREDLSRAIREAQGSFWGLVLCLASLGLLIVGQAGSEFFLQRSSLVLLLIGVDVVALGRPSASGAGVPAGLPVLDDSASVSDL